MLSYDCAQYATAFSEKTGEALDIKPLNDLGFGTIGTTVLSWLNAVNNTSVHERRRLPDRILSFALEDGVGFDSAILHCHGDFTDESSVGRKIHRSARLIRWHNGDKHYDSRFRVRYTKWGWDVGLNGTQPHTNLLDLVDVNYDADLRSMGLPAAAQAGLDIANHIGEGSFAFDYYRIHQRDEPTIKFEEMHVSAQYRVLPIRWPDHSMD